MSRHGHHESRAHYRDKASPGAGKEQVRAAEALARLRAENRRNSGRPWRAATLAEAEQAEVLQDQNTTPVGILRENALTGKHKGTAQPRKSVV